MKIIMYTLSTCPWCRKTKQFFKEKKIPFDYVDYDQTSNEEQARIRREISKFTRSFSFPIVMIGEEVVIGYNPERYIELLNLE